MGVERGNAGGAGGGGGAGVHFLSELRWYYARLFPIELMHRWLGYGQPDSQIFARREVSFTLAGDIYLRYRSFRSAEELHAALKERTPVKIDFGAVFNIAPRDRGASAAPMVAMQKELVFDIDMTDYEDVLGDLATGSPTEMTDANWGYMATAAQVIDTALRKDFGFEHILWVYSGRRGIHCWVADQRARLLSNEARAAVAEFLALRFESIESGANARRAAHLVSHPLHPSLHRAKRAVCEPLFKDFVLGDQNILGTDERVTAMLQFVPDAALRERMENHLLTRGSRWNSHERWDYIERELRNSNLYTTIDYLILRHTYPRLDIAVSKDVGHLLKAPFCVHPKTGRVCVPFEARDAFEFAPERDAPQLSELIRELNERMTHNGADGDDNLDDVRNQPTTIKFAAAVQLLREFTESMEQANAAAERERRSNVAAAGAARKFEAESAAFLASTP